MNSEIAQPELTHGLPKSVWGSLPEESDGYMKFTSENQNSIRVRFIDNEPRQAPSKFNKEQMVYEFEVIDLSVTTPEVKIWSVSSIKLMRQLESHIPLDGKSFNVIRSGEGMTTEYTVLPMV